MNRGKRSVPRRKGAGTTPISVNASPCFVAANMPPTCAQHAATSLNMAANHRGHAPTTRHVAATYVMAALACPWRRPRVAAIQSNGPHAPVEGGTRWPGLKPGHDARGPWAGAAPAGWTHQSSKGSLTRIVSSRSGLVESSVTGHSISSSIVRTYLTACAGNSAQLRAPARRLRPALECLVDRLDARLRVRARPAGCRCARRRARSRRTP